MLSRGAESLYWLARYVERAEDVARLLDVEFHGQLDGHAADSELAWRMLLRTLGKEALFAEHHERATAGAVADFVLWHPANPDAVTSCIVNARENARRVRDQLSSEMWERLNRLYLLVKDADPGTILPNPHAFFVRVRDGSHSFQGVTEATMEHGEADRFLKLGASLERADLTARVLLERHRNGGTATEEPAALVDLLRSCGAFEAYRRSEGARLTGGRVAEFLLLDRVFPRSVLCCLELALHAVREISGPSAGPERTIGRLCAELSFLDVDGGPEPFRTILERVQSQLADAGAELAAAYFSTRVLAPAAADQARAQAQQ
jgi:uncharacterized alpha-E superfamily protein